MPRHSLTNEASYAAYEKRLAMLRAEGVPRPDEHHNFPIVIRDGEREVVRVILSKPSDAFFDRIHKTGYPLQSSDARRYHGYRATWHGDTEWLIHQLNETFPRSEGWKLPFENAADPMLWERILGKIAEFNGFQIELLFKTSHGRAVVFSSADERWSGEQDRPENAI
jgi:hypothetical protein